MRDRRRKRLPAGDASLQSPARSRREAISQALHRQPKPGAPPSRVQTPGGSFVVDREGMILAFDRGVESLTGWTRAEVLGRSKDLGLYGAPDELGVRSYRSVPLYHGRLPRVGEPRHEMLYVTRRDGWILQVETLLAPAGSARQPATAVELRRVLARFPPAGSIPDLAKTDPLSFLPRPMLFLDCLEEHLARARELDAPLSLLVLGIDHIGELARSQGEEHADEVRRQSAGILRAAVRENDVASRLDGSEFAILLPLSGRADARLIGGRIRRLIESLSLRGLVDGRRHRVTVSIGAACHPADGTTSGELMRRAHRALAEARRLGGNRVWCYVRRPRVETCFPVLYDGPIEGLVGEASNLSTSGVLVEARDPLPLGVRIAMKLDLPARAGSAHVVGRVARHVRDGERPLALPALGIEFERLGQASRDLIENLVHRSLVGEA
jgi:diguanylate cyclase (GGDEF)-like protein/PAS domain S-box-containing protein